MKKYLVCVVLLCAVSQVRGDEGKLVEVPPPVEAKRVEAQKIY